MAAPSAPKSTPSRTNRAARRHPNPAPPAYVGIRAAAEYLDLSEKTIRRLIGRGELRAYRFGARVVKLKRADLDGVYTTPKS
ncbi:MAG TPA: helix-turn-helix domain-containing protein [Mycobacterium sp.]|nr:helix-turn-helix domain-containing protein [Mycobacterium sp.]